MMKHSMRTAVSDEFQASADAWANARRDAETEMARRPEMRSQRRPISRGRVHGWILGLGYGSVVAISIPLATVVTVGLDLAIEQRPVAEELTRLARMFFG